MKALFLTLLISLNCYGLEPAETLKTRIIELIPTNYIVLNRGSNDDIKKGEHVQILLEENLVSRAVCIEQNPTASLWKVYRILSPELFELDLDFTLKSLALSTIRPHEQLKKQEVPPEVLNRFQLLTQ